MAVEVKLISEEAYRPAESSALSQTQWPCFPWGEKWGGIGIKLMCSPAYIRAKTESYKEWVLREEEVSREAGIKGFKRLSDGGSGWVGLLCLHDCFVVE